jgi:hypothetical protein
MVAEFSYNNYFAYHEFFINQSCGLVQSNVPSRDLTFRCDESLIVVVRIAVKPANIWLRMRHHIYTFVS